MRAPAALALLALLAAPAVPASHEPLPDLAGVVRPADVAPDAPVHVEGFVQNAGDADARAFDVEVFVNGTRVETLRLDPVAAGQGAWFVTAANVTLAEGTHAFELRIDGRDQVAESDETNNVATTLERFAHARPDLETTIRHARVEDWPRPRVVAEYRVCNLGNGTADETIAVYGWLYGGGLLPTRGPLPFPERTHAPLAPGACVHGTTTVDAPDDLVGYRTLSLHAEQRGGVPVREWTMENNRGTANVWMGPGRDPGELFG